MNLFVCLGGVVLVWSLSMVRGRCGEEPKRFQESQEVVDSVPLSEMWSNPWIKVWQPGHSGLFGRAPVPVSQPPKSPNFHTHTYKYVP